MAKDEDEEDEGKGEAIASKDEPALLDAAAVAAALGVDEFNDIDSSPFGPFST